MLGLNLFLLGVIGLATGVTGVCNNVVSNSACCQTGNYGATAAFSGPYSIFNVGNIGYGQPYTVASTSGRGYYGVGNVGYTRRIERNSCLRVDPIPTQIRDVSSHVITQN